jgi:restriction endonuclease Mrr
MSDRFGLTDEEREALLPSGSRRRIDNRRTGVAQARTCSFARRERLVVQLLERMGYGRSGAVEHSGRTGKAGIDGIISQDRSR